VSNRIVDVLLTYKYGILTANKSIRGIRPQQRMIKPQDRLQVFSDLLVAAAAGRQPGRPERKMI